MQMRALGILFAVLLLLLQPAWAEVEFSQRERLAAADMRLAADWIAHGYKIPERVPQEMLIQGYSYAETLIALGLMGEGASLNDILELRRLRGGGRWREIAEDLSIDPDKLPLPLREILWFGRNQRPAPVIHFLPDVRPGLRRKLVINAFEPTVPSEVLRRRFRLNDREVADIRTALDDPLGVPEGLMRQTAGRGLLVADWVLAGAVSYHKPFPMESLLAARVGEDLPWSEIALAFGLRPDVLTQGPLSGVYPLITGAAPNTVLCARRRTDFPQAMDLEYDLERLTPGEKKALAPLLYHRYQIQPHELKMLDERNYEFAESAITVALARMAELDLNQILEKLDRGETWSGLIKTIGIDMTGHPELLAAIEARGGAPQR